VHQLVNKKNFDNINMDGVYVEKNMFGFLVDKAIIQTILV
jgi:hypothetical protein